MATTIKNQANHSADRSRTTGTGTYTSAVDSLTNQIEEQKKQIAKNTIAEKGTFLGVMLACSAPMSLDEFSSYFPKNESFYSEVLQKSGKKLEPSVDGYFLESFVHIPEITSMLPFPNLKSIYEFNNIYGSDMKTQDKIKQIENRYDDLIAELIKVTTFPKFYKYCSSGEIYAPGRFVKIRYPGSFPTYGVGVLEEIYKGTYTI